ncbi:hypothetical protein VQ045_16920 [Aurantimonas sp. E1-2-R+4]|uniref:hypothetical protein n=1 Tax=Aurantimonas sp. E1-2-R+4 TaxID=3113714 RepID=UPI002F91ED7A
MPRFTINANGSLTADDGSAAVFKQIDHQLIHVPHLAPHVILVPMPRDDVIGIKVIYLSHCWNESYDPVRHVDAPMLIMDGIRPRVFNIVRFEESRVLPAFLADLSNHRLYWTPADRNFGVYNATTIIDGLAYTAFFTLKKERGKLSGIRHSLVMRVESAYHAPQPSVGQRVKAGAAIDAALKGKKLKFR